MKIELTDREVRVMESIAKSRNGKIWLDIFKKVIDNCVDLRTVKTSGENFLVELKAREKAAELIQENFVEPIERLAHGLNPPEDDFK